ncbi:hypothetical protein ACT48Z_000647 [Citrobacter freundii]|jgi:hypothetical protein|uniref:hypothetical protein n=1 Tax=Citrobacter freundii TaxID=546 RepID=UPI000A3C2563|nr:hypothetical protein [Citrobacter freundii]DAJ46080.1 MAG TPA: hypothetical protein [Caudoviricetes sp.]EJC6091367.1 hypothetical protein [Citrobacter freundii]EKV1033255.1 hypothetical protein [Citrobacter freundii]EKW5569161.1 hypothetical protein [Citrobacter freundii]EKX6740823.1 hypothetical protein [Citrobacter freundii]
MNTEYISYESLVAARESALWAKWAMYGTWLSAIATLIAALIACFAIFGWRKQEEASELKTLRISVYHYNMALIRAPEFYRDNFEQFDFIRFNETYNALAEVYKSTLMMHRFKTRGKASELYSELADIQRKYTSGKISNSEAESKVSKIRNSNSMLIESN